MTETKFETKWLVFKRDMESRAKTQVWWVYNKADEYLGCIRWYSQWRQYCFIVEHDNYEPMKLVYAKSCLDDISEMIERLMEERRPAQIQGTLHG